MSLSRQSFRSARISLLRPPFRSMVCRRFNSTPSNEDDIEARRDDDDDVPRWARTPPAMKAPFPIYIPKDPRRQIWTVNEDPEQMERAYERFIGLDLTRRLPEELKWLAVTHRSFDQGRRGFNTRLAYYGRQILALETTRSIMMAAPAIENARPDPYGRTPFHHPSLANVDKLGLREPRDMISPEKIAKLAHDTGLPPIVRWKPRLPENLQASGLDVVLTTTVQAIIGAVSLQQGADVASRLVMDRILRRAQSHVD